MASHRGFSPKVRGVLLDPPGSSTPQEEQAKLNNLEPSKATQSLRRLFGLAKTFGRTDSESSQKSNSSTNSCPVKESDFDSMRNSPTLHQGAAGGNVAPRLISEIGKAQSFGELSRRQKLNKCVKDQEIMRPPSLDYNHMQMGSSESTTSAVAQEPEEEQDMKKKMDGLSVEDAEEGENSTPSS
uniref:Myelin basic protein n=1 Tax=Steinernema glaseri TaxID=37863 RepID=A0A1I8A6S1_9BILA